MRYPEGQYLRRVEPLTILQFLHYGRPIGTVETCSRKRIGAGPLGKAIIADVRLEGMTLCTSSGGSHKLLGPLQKEQTRSEGLITHAQALKAESPERGPGPGSPIPKLEPEPVTGVQTRTIRLVGAVPPEVWDCLATKVLPKLRWGLDLKVGVDLSVTVNQDLAESLTSDLHQILHDPGLADKV